MAFQSQKFDKPYGFKNSKRVVISHKHNGTFRVNPQNQSVGDGYGAHGPFAQWQIHIENNGLCRLQSEQTGKYVRIWQRGDTVDVSGGGGPFCYFKIHHSQTKNIVKLESERFPGKYIAFKPNKTMKCGKGGDMCYLTFWKRQGGGNNNNNNNNNNKGFAVRQPVVKPVVKPVPKPVIHPKPVAAAGFNSPYHFKRNQRIVMRGPHGGHVRVTPNNLGFIDCQGRHGLFAQWDASIVQGGLVTLRNVKSGGYLRIFQQGSTVDASGKNGKFCYFRVHNAQGAGVFKLESAEFNGKFIAMPPNGNPRVGMGGKHCFLTCFKQGQQQQQQQQRQPVIVQPQPVIHQQNNNKNKNNNNQIFDKAYHFKQNKTVVIGGPHGKHLRVSPANNSFADGSGGHGGLAQWEVILSGGDLIQLKSCKTGGYLRIYDNGSRIDVSGKGGQFTYFKYHTTGGNKNNVVKLQSNMYPRSWVAIPKDYTVTVGRGGPHCVLTFWKQAGGNNNNNNNAMKVGMGVAAVGAVAAMGAAIAQNQKIINQQQRVINQQNAEIEGQMSNMTISSGNSGGGTRVCPLCGGKGYYGTFGWCDASSIHKKGVCQLCGSSGYVENCNWIQCNQCNGKGGIGTFGPCDRWDIHYKHNCGGCSGYGYNKGYQ